MNDIGRIGFGRAARVLADRMRLFASDRSGVSALEYCVLLGVVAIAAVSAQAAGNVIWGKDAVLAHPTSTAPNTLYPNGPVVGATQYVKHKEGTWHFTGPNSLNGVLTMTVQDTDLSPTVFTVPLVDGVMSSFQIPNTGGNGAITYGAALPGEGPPSGWP